MAEARRHLSDIQRIDDQKRRLSYNNEERIRGIPRQGMCDVKATEDRKAQASSGTWQRCRVHCMSNLMACVPNASQLLVGSLV